MHSRSMEYDPCLKLPGFPSRYQDWTLLYCKVMVLFVLQGVILLMLYAMRGFASSPDGMPPGIRNKLS